MHLTSRNDAPTLADGTPGPTAQRLGNACLATVALAVALMVLVAFMGPSNTVPKTGLQLSLRLHPSVWLVVPLVWTIAALGGIAPLLGLLALRKGWRPAPRTLLLAALPVVALLAILPVAGSTDALSYAVYGRISVIGHDPYSWTPMRLINSHDPVGRYAPQAWRNTPSLYGPVATALFSGAALFCGASMAKIVFLLKLFMGACFAFTAWALDRLAGPSVERRARVLVLWTLNPAMLWACVSSGHVDVLAVAFVAAALLAWKQWTFPRAGKLLVVGLLLGAAAAVKAPLILAGLGFAWTVRRSLRDLIALGVGGVLILGTSYLIAGRAAVHVLRAKSDSFSPISPWRWPLHLLHNDLWKTGPMGVIGLVTGLLVIGLLAWRLPAAHPDLPEIRPLFVLLCGWLVTSPLQRPWYDAIVFSLLALMPRTQVDEILVVRGAVGTYGFLPGVNSPKPHPWPGPMRWTAQVFVPWIVSATMSLVLTVFTFCLVSRNVTNGPIRGKDPASMG